MSFDRNVPHNDLPDLPPALELETKAVLKQAISANRALAELKGLGDLIPNQGVLVRLIGLQEAKLSSEIENIVTTNDELYRAFSDEQGKFNPATKEVLHYNEALWYGYNKIKERGVLGTRLFEEIATQIKEVEMRVRTVPGTKIGNSATGAVIYTPPEGQRVIRDMLANLERFIYNVDDDLDPLIKLAIIHYQFEAIHPFSDGNGRTGRILNVLYLIECGLLELPVLYLSQFIIANRAAYYDGLRRVTEEQAWEDWILYVLRAVEVTSLETRDRILAIRKLMQDVSDTVRERLPRIYSKDLIEVLFQQPYTRIRFLEQSLSVSRQTASSHLKKLEEIGLLSSFRAGNEVYYINRGFVDLLTR